MDRTKQAMDVLNFWYAAEYLQPNKFPAIDITKEKFKAGDRTQFHTYCFMLSKDANIRKCLNFTVEDKLKEQDDELQICVGRIEIRPIIEQIFEKTGEASPEKIQSEHICLLSLRVDSVGNYVEETLQISPFVWCCNAVIRNAELNFDRIGPIGNVRYCRNFENMLVDKNIALFEKIENLYSEISDTLLSFLSVEKKLKSRFSVVIFNKYKDEKAKYNYQGDYIYSDLQQSYFLKDIDFIKNRVSEKSKVLNYILALNEVQTPKANMLTDTMEIKEWYTPGKLPFAKWASKYNLSFMQQLAVNIGHAENNKVGDIFSVNGPPGTGKTTLLKEIAVANIVARASELLKYSCPDDAFTEKKLLGCYDQNTVSYFIPAPELNKYGMLVLSSNNNAVENITMELPKASQMKKGNTKTDLFDLEVSPHSVKWEVSESEKKEIYFSYPATLTMEGQDCWGLISTRLGKRKNVNEFCKALNKIVFHKWKGETPKSGKISFCEAKAAYSKQLAVVQKMRDPIEKSIDFELELLKEKQEFDYFVDQKESEIFRKEKKKRSNEKNRERKKALLCDMQSQIAKDKSKDKELSKEIEDLVDKISALEDKRNFFERVIPEPNNPITKYIAKLFHTEKMSLISENKKEKKQTENSRTKIRCKIEENLSEIRKLETSIKKCGEELLLLDRQIAALQEAVKSKKMKCRNKIAAFKTYRGNLENKGIHFLTKDVLDGLMAESGA